MIVCHCNVLTDHQVKGCLTPGPDCPRSPAQVYRCLGCSAQCGRCARTIRALMDAALPRVQPACQVQDCSGCVHGHDGAHRPADGREDFATSRTAAP